MTEKANKISSAKMDVYFEFVTLVTKLGLHADDIKELSGTFFKFGSLNWDQGFEQAYELKREYENREKNADNKPD